ncbi:hypothetical protein L218DRAFT_997586 [Marasmius fiardii PR-910]|nr:hypothetical protein L218DRAFT_997586 [Marasmius fiardii PR-910]
MSTSLIAYAEHRLPTNVKPTRYELTIRTDLDKLVFDGLVNVSLDVNENTDTIVLNATGLQLGQASVTRDTDTPVIEIEHVFHEKQKRVVFKFPVEFQAGSKLQFRLAFSGQLLDGHAGYNRCSWEREGKTSYYALTQFSVPTDARRGFPCWDEPQLKATYAITLVSKSNTTNLSNMPVHNEKIFSIQDYSELGEAFQDLDAHWKITRFETTPPMSSYIVAYANGEFSHLETSVKMPLSGRTIPVRMYATPDLIPQAQFALELKSKVLPLCEKIFDVEYPLPKLDTLVVHNFGGAAEFWGLIIGGPRSLLLDPNSADMWAKKLIIKVHSHEIAHMWRVAKVLFLEGASDIPSVLTPIGRFGDITTMKWWDYLYLNEGFATLMGEVIIPDKCVHAYPVRPMEYGTPVTQIRRIYPELKANTEFINRHLTPAMTLDVKPSSHPVEVPCPDADLIRTLQVMVYSSLLLRNLNYVLFDALSYSKAASVLRMLAAYVGTDQFLRGVSIYLKNHLYGSTDTRDLWDGIGEATGQNIGSFMDSWITKTGFPVLIVKEVDKGILVRQERLLGNGVAEGEVNETIWYELMFSEVNIPLGILSIQADGTPSIDNSLVLEDREKLFPLDTSRPFKLNAGTNGFYRVLYTEDMLKKIANELSSKQTSAFNAPEDRLGLITDVIALSKAALIKLSDALGLIDACATGGETEFYIWSGISTALNEITSIWWDHTWIRESLKAFRRSLFFPLVERLGYVCSSSDSPDITQLRTVAIEQCVFAGEMSVVDELKGRFKSYVDTGDDSRIPPDLLKAAFIAAVLHGGRAEYEAVKKILDKPKTSSTRVSAIYALTSTNDLALMKESLQYVLSGAKDSDVPYFFLGFNGNGDARKTVVEFFQQHYDELYNHFVDTYYFKFIIEYGFSGLTSTSDLNDLVGFFDDKETSKYSMFLAQSFDSIRARIAFIEHSSEDLEKWLTGRKERGSALQTITLYVPTVP